MPTPVPPIPFVGAFESTYQPLHDRDVAETTQHTERWREDLVLLDASGVNQLRYPLRWHRIEPEPGHFYWRETDEILGFLHDGGYAPIVDLLHHTSYPLWVGDFSSAAFGPAFLRFVEKVAERYPWLPAYTVFNEPFTTFLLCGQLGVWPPYHRGLEGFIGLAENIFPAVTEATRILRDLLPDARHFHVEVCERHTWATPAGAEMATMANDRRFLLTDLLVGRPMDSDRPFVRELVAAGGAGILEVEPGHIDVLGLDYYAHNQWHWSGPGIGTTVSPVPVPLAELIGEYWGRYEVPCMLGETNIRGYAADRASWLKYTLEQCEKAAAAGVPFEGYCWFPFIDSADWGSLLAECVGTVDPVGVFWLDGAYDRRPSSMSVSYAMAAGGAPAAELPAYRFRRPVADWLAGWLPHMGAWEWRDPPGDEICSSRHEVGDLLTVETSDVA